jgi:hypothetical protein
MSEETPSTNINETPSTSTEETAASNTEETVTSSAGETSTTNTETEAPAPVSAGRRRRALTPAELAARRANARKSTGPRTPAGKRRSSRNAMKHGFYCGQSAFYSAALYDRIQDLGEDAAEFTRIQDGLRTSFVPSNEVQRMLVHEIALLEWQRQRLERAQAALLARRIQKLEIERERESMTVSEKINTEIRTPQLQAGLLYDKEESPTKYQNILEWLETLQGCVDLKNYEPAEAILGWIYGPIPSVRGVHIKALFGELVKRGPKAPPDKSAVSTLRLELNREISNVAANYKFYLREHTGLTPTMREECLGPTGKQRVLMGQMGAVDRRIDQKIRLLITLQKVEQKRAAAREPQSQPQEDGEGREEAGRTPHLKLEGYHNYM